MQLQPRIYRLRNLFIQKLRRSLLSQTPHEIVREEKEISKWLQIPAISLPERVIHGIYLADLIALFILMVLATFDGFID